MFTAITSHVQGRGRDLWVCPTQMCPSVYTGRLCHLSLQSSQSATSYYCDAYSTGFCKLYPPIGRWIYHRNCWYFDLA